MKTINTTQVTLDKSAFNAALHAKCPKCRTGNMFATGMYGFTRQKMNKTCPHCGFTFEVEPGYFYVAMFVSYGINVAFLVTIAVAISVLTGSKNPWLYVGMMLAITFVLAPVTFRYSRVILLYWLTPGIHFDPKRAAADYVPFSVRVQEHGEGEHAEVKL